MVLIAHRLGLSPSQLLMPVAFAGSAGGMLMLMSSPVNVIVSEAAGTRAKGRSPSSPSRWSGSRCWSAPCCSASCSDHACCRAGSPEHSPPDLTGYADTLEAQYQLTDGFYRLRVRSRSDLDRPGPRAVALGDGAAVRVVAAESPDGRGVVGARWGTTTPWW